MIRALLVYTVALVVVALTGSVYAAIVAVSEGYWWLALPPLIVAAVLARVCWLLWSNRQKNDGRTVKNK